MNDEVAVPASKLVKNQKKTFGPVYFKQGKHRYRIVAKVRHDDECGNGHNTFVITTETWRSEDGLWLSCGGGADHSRLDDCFPVIKGMDKWHLTSTDAPMHYISNALYHMEKGDLKAARSAAVWPDMEEAQCTREILLARLPQLMEQFKADVEALGFVY